MDARTGIFRALLCQAGSLHNAPIGIVPIGIRKPGTYKIGPFNTLKDYRNREMRNMMNFNFSADSYQMRIRDLQWLILFLSTGFDAQIAMNRQSLGFAAPASGGIFDLVDGEWGMDFKFVNTEKERYTTITLEKAMEYENALALIQGSTTPADLLPTISADPISGGNERGENFNNYAHPWFLAVEGPTGTAIFSKDEILSRNFTIATKGQKNGYNKTIVDYLSFTLELVATNGTIEKMTELMEKDMSPSLTVKENYNWSTYVAGVLPTS
jgi:hypothetical protein